MPKSRFITSLILSTILLGVVGPVNLVSASTPAINFVYVPPYGTPNDPTGNADKLTGEVHNVNPDDYVVAVYIYVFESWWTKPYTYAPTTPITKIDDSNGTWVCDIVTDEFDPNGDDEHATQIVAFLIPKADLSSQMPPILLGSTTIPSTLDPYSRVEITRTPTITGTFKSIDTHDGWILESAETSNMGGTMNNTASTLNLGDDAAKKQYRSVLSFNTSSLPDNAVITKVTLRLRRQGVAGGGNPVALFQGLMVDIKKGTLGTAPLALGDFKVNASNTVGPQSPALTAGWYNLNLTPAKAYVNKLETNSGLTQMRLRFKLDDNNNNIANILKLYSGDAVSSSRPQLIIKYSVPNP